ncbi:COX15/CtaA family protein [Acuticoccus sp.]|uniref:COX15/CtaA family protein n=1 Tax=Acuticoccus sp. TaxID=1904378 RepID=UPI003B53006C
MDTDASIAWWLRIVAAFVVATLVVGGATRLTDSGLSITEWRPILGVVPPLTEAAWQEAFALYRQIPEYQLVNRGMSLADFQVIYWWEWAHRAVARTIGLAFALPLAWFWLRGRLPDWFKPWALVLLALGALQGAVGWWMVTSGLTERVDVSQYRLVVHLTLACVILALTVWLSVRLAGRAGGVEAPTPVRLGAVILPFAILIQIALGGLVAGMDAGLASDQWPLMAGAVVPDGLLLLDPWWANAFENPLTAQFNHRLAGYLLLALVLWHAAAAVRASAGAATAVGLAALVVAQAAIGVGVVVWRVPLELAGLHQVMAAVILWVATAHAARLGYVPATRAVSAQVAAAHRA